MDVAEANSVLEFVLVVVMLVVVSGGFDINTLDGGGGSGERMRSEGTVGSGRWLWRRRRRRRRRRSTACLLNSCRSRARVGNMVGK